MSPLALVQLVERKALETILHGEDTEEAATHWWVFRAMSDTVHPTLFKPIDYEVDLDARVARAVIPGVLESSGRPIRPRCDSRRPTSSCTHVSAYRPTCSCGLACVA